MDEPYRDTPGPSSSLTDILQRLAAIERLLVQLLAQPHQPLLPPLTDPHIPPHRLKPLLYDPALEEPNPLWVAVLHARSRPRPPSLDPDETPPVPQHSPAVGPGCGKPALYLIRPFTRTERADITQMRVRLPHSRDWQQPKPGDISLCSSCGAPVDPWSEQDLDYASVLLPAASRRDTPQPSAPEVLASSGTGPTEPDAPASMPAGFTPETAAISERSLQMLRDMAQEAGLYPSPSAFHPTGEGDG